MDELLEHLKQLYEESEDNSYYYEEEHSTYFKNSKLSDECICLANMYLVTSNGGCNWDNIYILRDNGYKVFAGERDSFGWLTGCIRKEDDKRILVYG